MAVRYWKDGESRMAESSGVVFCAFPHQPYYGRHGDRCAVIADILVRGDDTPTGGFKVDKKWAVRTGKSLPSGSNEWTGFRRFDENEKDAAFEWAASSST